jgi:hypothetical protein
MNLAKAAQSKTILRAKKNGEQISPFATLSFRQGGAAGPPKFRQTIDADFVCVTYGNLFKDGASYGRLGSRFCIQIIKTKLEKSMNKLKKSGSFRLTVAIAGGLAMFVVSSHAQNSLSATATLSDTPNGGSFDYTLTLDNTGSVDINSLWYGWIVGVFNLPVPGSDLQNVQNSLGWSATDFGNSVEFENNLGGSALTPGSSMNFTFTSAAAPDSFITDASSRPVASIAYAAANGPSTFGQSVDGVASDPTPTVLAAPAPEPSSLALLAVGGFGLVLIGWKKCGRSFD